MERSETEIASKNRRSCRQLLLKEGSVSNFYVVFIIYNSFTLFSLLNRVISVRVFKEQ